MKEFFKRYPLFAYFTSVYSLAWGGILVINFYNGFQLFHGENVLSKGISGQLMLVWLIMLVAPGIAGLFLIRMVDGKERIKKFLSSMGRGKVSIRWYAAALLIIPALLIPISYSFVLVSKNYSPGLILATGIGAGLVGGFLEEIGWTGFALPKLQLRYPPFVTGIILGFIHAVWHLPADYLGGISFYEELYWFHFMLWIIALTAFRLLSVWIYNNSKSLLLAQLTHASFTGGQLIFGPPAATEMETVLWYAVFTAFLCLVVTIIVLKDKKMFFEKLTNEK
jgi:membrane protease YdiL (CAAX protease family)